MTIVGKEDVAGKPGFWLEMAMANPRASGQMFMKYLIAPGDNGMISARMIMQMPGQDPMEMDMNMMGARRGPAAAASLTPSDIRSKADLVGTDRRTAPSPCVSRLRRDV